MNPATYIKELKLNELTFFLSAMVLSYVKGEIGQIEISRYNKWNSITPKTNDFMSPSRWSMV